MICTFINNLYVFLSILSAPTPPSLVMIPVFVWWAQQYRRKEFICLLLSPPSGSFTDGLDFQMLGYGCHVFHSGCLQHFWVIVKKLGLFKTAGILSRMWSLCIIAGDGRYYFWYIRVRCLCLSTISWCPEVWKNTHTSFFSYFYARLLTVFYVFVHRTSTELG